MKKDYTLNTKKLLYIAFIISQSAFFIQESISFIDYIASIIVFLMVVINKKITISKSYINIVFSIVLALFGGIMNSYLFEVNNNNILLACIIVVNCLSYFMICTSGKINKTSINELFDLFIVFGIISCVYNLIINYNDIISLSISSNPYYSAQFSSFYSGRNTFGFFLFFYSSICLYQLVVNKNRRKYYLLTMCLFLLNLFFTFSRASIVATGIMILIFLHNITENSKQKKLIYVLFIVVTIIVLFVVAKNNYEYISHFLIRSDYGNTNRSLLWSKAISISIEGIAFGFGPGCAEKILLLETISASSFHNTYIEIYMWGGLTLVIAYIIVFKKLTNAIKIIYNNDLVFGKFYQAFLIANLFYCFFETSMFFALGAKGHTLTILVFVVPIIYSNYIKEKNNEK